MVKRTWKKCIDFFSPMRDLSPLVIIPAIGYVLLALVILYYLLSVFWIEDDTANYIYATLLGISFMGAMYYEFLLAPLTIAGIIMLISIILTGAKKQLSSAKIRIARYQMFSLLANLLFTPGSFIALAFLSGNKEFSDPTMFFDFIIWALILLVMTVLFLLLPIILFRMKTPVTKQRCSRPRRKK